SFEFRSFALLVRNEARRLISVKASPACGGADYESTRRCFRGSRERTSADDLNSNRRAAMLSLARAVHVLGVLWWVGGVAMVTATILPALRSAGLSDAERQRIFRTIRGRFVWQARAAVLLVGASGAYLLAYLGGIARLRAATAGWWIDLMLFTWAVFALLLSV